jgi:branched-chain amino acid transport system permease protein
MTGRIAPWLWTLAILAVLAVPPLLQSARLLDLVIQIVILGLFATAVNLLIGYTGMVTFGHAMFYASGAYGFALLMRQGSFSVPMAMALATGASALLSVVVSLVCIKTREIYFALLTLAIQMMFYNTVLSWQDLTGGDQGLTGGFPRPPFFGFDFAQANDMYLFIVIVVAICLALMWHLTESPFGHGLRMVRDNASRAEYLGMNVKRYRLAAFVLAACFASIAGSLMSLYVSAAYPNFGYWTMSGEAIFVIMLGGLTSFLGPMAGATLVTLLNHAVTAYTAYYGLVFGTVVLLFALGLRRGVLDIVVERLAQSRSSSPR